MAEVRQIPVDEYEAQKKSYGFTDEQMRSIIGVEPLKTRWADGFGESRKKEEPSAKERHQQLVEEIKNRLKNEQTSGNTASAQSSNIQSPSVSEKVEVKTEEVAPVPPRAEVKVEEPMPTPPKAEEVAPAPEPIVDDVPAFDVPTFEMPQVENVVVEEEVIKTEPKTTTVDAENTSVVEDAPVFEMPDLDEAKEEVVEIEPVVEEAKDSESKTELEPVVEEAKDSEPKTEPESESTVDAEEESFNVPTFEMPQFDDIVVDEEVITDEVKEVPDFSANVAQEIVDAPTFENPVVEEKVSQTNVSESTVSAQGVDEAGEKIAVDDMFEIGRKKLLDLMREDRESFKTIEFTR